MNVIKTLALVAVIAMLAACNKASEEAAAPASMNAPGIEHRSSDETQEAGLHTKSQSLAKDTPDVEALHVALDKCTASVACNMFFTPPVDQDATHSPLIICYNSEYGILERSYLLGTDLDS